MCTQPQQSCKLRPVLKRRERGQAIVETAFMAPWIVFLFVGVLDVGFYCYALMTVENAARLAVIQTSAAQNTAGSAALACPIVYQEVQSLPNMFNSGVCQQANNNCTSVGPATKAIPLYVGACSTTHAAIDGISDISSKVVVSYQSVQVIPIPGIIAPNLVINRTAEMQVNLDE